MPNLKIYDLFISHAWTYNEEYYSLESKLKNYPYFVYRNYSVPKHDSLDTETDAELTAALDRQIKPVNIVIVLAGMYVNYRRWIQEEIKIAQKYRKPIIAIRPRGAERMPQELVNIANDTISWNIDSIVTAIRKYSL